MLTQAACAADQRHQRLEATQAEEAEVKRLWKETNPALSFEAFKRQQIAAWREAEKAQEEAREREEADAERQRAGLPTVAEFTPFGSWSEMVVSSGSTGDTLQIQGFNPKDQQALNEAAREIRDAVTGKKKVSKEQKREMEERM